MSSRASKEGTKHDEDKLRVDLLPTQPLQAIAAVLTHGAVKYGARNWEKGMAWHRAYGAALRHLLAWRSGSDKDSETGLSHLAHAACEILFLLQYQAHNMGEDDRP